MKDFDLTCARREAALSSLVDGDLDGEVRDELRAHLKGCQRCQDVLDGYRRVAGRAGALEDRPPTHDLWPGIAERIGASPPAEHRDEVPGRKRWVPQLLAASLVVTMTAAAATMFWPAAEPVLVAGDLPDAAEDVPVVEVSTGYDEAIAHLVQVFEGSRQVMDAGTVETIERNLAVIDAALFSARQALADDPESMFLRRHMERTARQKLEILQRVTAIAADD